MRAACAKALGWQGAWYVPEPREGQQGWGTVNKARLAQGENISRPDHAGPVGPGEDAGRAMETHAKFHVVVLVLWLLSGPAEEEGLSGQEEFLHWSQ